MWLVRLALRKPYTVAVMAALIFVLGLLTIETTPTDIFPEIDIPVVNVVWFYQGLTPEDMTNYITTFSEFTLTQYVDNVQRVESRTLYGLNVIRMYFQPGVSIDAALAEVGAICQTVIKRMPLGTTPPYVLRYSASEVPVIQVAVSGKTKSAAELFDYSWYVLRRDLATIRGSTWPPPWGGTPRFIMVDTDPNQLLARGLTADEVMNAINDQNLDLPSGDVKIGDYDYLVSVNNVLKKISKMNDFPIQKVNGQLVYMHDIGHVRDGGAVQWNVAHVNGVPAVVMPMLKNGLASTLQLVADLRKLIPASRAAAPEGTEIREIFDQSVFVKASVEGVVKEGLIAATLTGIMILVFLGSWRSTLIVLTSIPLCILVALFLLSRMGYTINIMTLGGLSLAVGVLVDDATVEVENIHRNHGLGKPLIQAILDGAQQIAAAAFMATLSIAIVFTSVIFLEGPPKFLFTPMALGVSFAILFSYFLSRTLVPTMADMLIGAEEEEEHRRIAAGKPEGRFRQFHRRFEERFEAFRERYAAALKLALHHRVAVFVLLGVLLVMTALVFPWTGRDFFPSVDAGKFRLHVFTPPGTRIEVTQRIFSQIEQYIRSRIPEEEIDSIVDNMGIPFWYPAALAYSDTINEGTFDGEILVSLKEDHRPTPYYMKELREELPRRFPGCRFFFQAADMVNQILNFGSAAPIDIQVSGKNEKLISDVANGIQREVRRIPGAVDAIVYQMRQPYLHLEVDRIRALDLGMTQKQVADNVLNQLSSSYVVAPNYWADPETTINYPLVVQSPQYKLDSRNWLLNINAGVPSTETYSRLMASRKEPQLISNMLEIQRTRKSAVISHYNMKPLKNVFVNIQGRDLGGVSSAVEKVVDKYQKQLPPGYEIHVRGQAQSMNSAFLRLGLGTVFAIMMVYFLLVVNFQGWLDPFIILTALPVGGCGIIWMLYLTGTTLNVPSLMGTIMTVGVSTSNSILLITFANEAMRNGNDALTAAWLAGKIRLRPVVMTAGAMILGMLPMSLGLGEGGEQNAPLGRAVIGGLLFATVGTLFVVPVIYSLIRGRGEIRE
ncbi:Multidrug resistance protein MdtC [Methylacidimicrobium cyclopophantes]|uniref:Multidrug resistance protein MdtC n=1 Tax=Methylacidimicrobium cyclopophantes TaxID=1041766 RepID=A0A5E6MPS2_9BACT|nr:efflux RND transporter permease subunit [Methylacidimicrobium cyclopophantes]VVM07470.1 Multidrug resistance protein MdtC [Methylacidimicrobium cyclopophantes]